MASLKPRYVFQTIALAHCLKTHIVKQACGRRNKFDMVHGTSPPRFQMDEVAEAAWCLILCVGVRPVSLFG
jgi:hypothetical protein